MRTNGGSSCTAEMKLCNHLLFQRNPLAEDNMVPAFDFTGAIGV